MIFTKLCQINEEEDLICPSCYKKIDEDDRKMKEFIECSYCGWIFLNPDLY